MGNIKDIIAVCEDKAHQTFLLACLSRLKVTNINHRVSRWVASTQFHGGNVGSVINYVKDVEFPTWENRCTRKKVLMIIVADADACSVKERAQQFPQVKSDLYIVIIPKRNIETWVQLGLHPQNFATITETIDYKSNSTLRSNQVKQSVETLFDLIENKGNKRPSGLNEHPVWGVFCCAMDALRKGLQALE